MPSNIRIRCIGLLTGCLSLLSAGVVRAGEAAAPATQPAQHAYLLHLPGVAGDTHLDRGLMRGLGEGGLPADTELYDWTCGEPGILALLARKRNLGEAATVARRIVEQFRADPRRKIYLTSHSGGAGIAVWALERLPDDVTVESVLLLAPALSPMYDLSRALRHVHGKAYVFSSTLDVAVLGAGTKVFGTMDGVKTDSAGLVGFGRPEGADAEQYDKLVSMPYDADWMRLGNIGDHIGPLTRRFARGFLAPLLLNGAAPPQAAAGS